jgi:hypothetical protein
MPDGVFPKHPLYIVSKGRSGCMLTSRALTAMGIGHFVVVEPQEVDAYGASIENNGLAAQVLELDLGCKATYELCDDLGQARGTGPGPARNFAWRHSIENGARWHWVIDDNIIHFYRLHANVKAKCASPAFFRAMEDFSERYMNVGMAGPHYAFFVPACQKRPPFIRNTRIYSCNLIRNNVPFRWRGRYNEDTILSVDMLKAGWCTIQFNAFLQGKAGTQSLRGGNTDEFYHREGTKRDGTRYADNGTLAKSQMLVRVHPDVSRLVWRYGRWHHHVDYRRFRKQKLMLRKGIVLAEAPNDYGMLLTAL